MADNLHFDLTGFSLETCLDIASKVHKQVKWYGVDQPYTAEKNWEKSHKIRLVLGWADQTSSSTYKTREIFKLPCPILTIDMAPIILAWLKNAPYSPEPDHDGDNKKGFRMYNEAWGHIGGDWSAFAAFEPVWLMYGK